MIATLGAERKPRALEFGIYRDGDNNLDAIQANVVRQALAVSARNPGIEFTLEDTTSQRGFAPAHVLRTEAYTIADGKPSSNVVLGAPHDMSDRANLARFVARTLDNAEARGAQATWLELVDHGAGDGGGLEADHGAGIMREDDIAGAISDGVALHASAHPEDPSRVVDGVVANECLMATLGFEWALSRAGVRYLAASPETMLAPGVPSSVADAIERNGSNPIAMARAVVDRVMRTRYEAGEGLRFPPAAAFDVFDLAPGKIAALESSVRALDAAIGGAALNRSTRAVVREDARAIDGMTRFRSGRGMPWRADRPALALYDTLASDGRLPDPFRAAARAAYRAVSETVLAHRESGDFKPFGDADYGDAAGPTVHFPIAANQIDAWKPQISETDNAFYRSVGAEAVARAVA